MALLRRGKKREVRKRFSLNPVQRLRLAVLGQKAKSRDPDVRWKVVTSLEEMGPAGAPLARSLAADPNQDVRWRVAISLESLGRGAVPAAKILSRDSDSVIRSVAEAFLKKHCK